MQRDWKVMVPAMPMFDYPFGCCGLKNLCEDLWDRLQREGIRDAIFAGNSLGGHVAALTAIHRPDLVRGLVLVGSSGLHERGLERGVPRRPDRAWLRRKVEEVFFDPAHVTEELLDSVSATVSNNRTLLNALRLAKSVKRSDLRPLLSRVRCPVTLVWGEEDQITPPEVAHDFARLLPQAELHFIERCGHAPQAECPAEFIRIFRSTLGRLVA